MKPRTYILMLLLTAMPVAAQEIVALNLPANLCAGADTTASVNVSFGQRDTHTVVIQSQHTTLGHSERIFLPDGVPCNGRCTYRSPVTFNAFTPGATVTSVNDIKYVRLNMEHSYIGDLYIGIRCPNGTRATLMRFNGSSSECLDTIPTSARGWLDGNNVDGYTFLGMPIDDEDANYECDSTRPHNAPGTGWNYCWSNNTNSGYSYASGDGIIYRQRNYRPRIDSSNVAAHTNYYHPDQNFSALIGCPLNGTWAIEVIDGFSGDNGYIFEWELSLDASLLPPMDCVPTGYRVEGPGVSPVNDSVFRLRVPGSVSSDTSVAYTFRVISSCGDTIDTTAHITVHPSPIVERQVEACGAYAYEGTTYTSDTTLVATATTADGCDSLHLLSITIHTLRDTVLRDTIVENQLPYPLGGIDFTTDADTTVTLNDIHGCDSTVAIHLTVHRNHSYTHTATICDNQLPYTFHGHTFEAADTVTDTHTDRYGADSVVNLQLTVHPTHYIPLHDTTCIDQLPYLLAGQPIYPPAADTYPLTFDTALLLASRHGCDSTIHLHLTIHPSHQVDIYDTICINTSYTFGDDTYSQSGDYAYPALNQYGCDSLTTLHLSILAGNLKARIHAIPTVATADRPHVQLYDQSTYVDHRLWAIGDQTSTERNLTYTFPGDVDSVEVHLTAYSVEGCSDTTATMLHIDRATIYLPNAFTPTESTNRTWHPVHLQLTELEIWIYNRHGFLVRHLEGTDAQWDGTDENGTPMPQGAYVYNLTYRTLHAPNQLQRRTGTITLIR